ELLAVAASVEARSEHPLAKAVVKAAQERGLALAEVTDFQAIPGRGVEAVLDHQVVHIGSPRYLIQNGDFPPRLVEARERLEAEGKTVMLVRRGGWLGLIALADQVRPEAKTIISRLKQQGIQQVAMLTGDNPLVAQDI